MVLKLRDYIIAVATFCTLTQLLAGCTKPMDGAEEIPSLPSSKAEMPSLSSEPANEPLSLEAHTGTRTPDTFAEKSPATVSQDVKKLAAKFDSFVTSGFAAYTVSDVSSAGHLNFVILKSKWNTLPAKEHKLAWQAVAWKAQKMLELSDEQLKKIGEENEDLWGISRVHLEATTFDVILSDGKSDRGGFYLDKTLSEADFN